MQIKLIGGSASAKSPQIGEIDYMGTPKWPRAHCPAIYRVIVCRKLCHMKGHYDLAHALAYRNQHFSRNC